MTGHINAHLTSISGSFRESKYNYKWSVRIDFDQCYVIDVWMSRDGLTDLAIKASPPTRNTTVSDE